MKEEMKKLLLIALRGAVFGIMALTASVALGAWTNPASAPTGSNISEPINIGTSAQTKDGNFSVGNSGGSRQFCLNGSCISSWPAAGSSYGGMYSTGGATNGDINDITGGKSCPAGYTVSHGFQVEDSVNSSWKYLFFCY